MGIMGRPAAAVPDATEGAIGLSEEQRRFVDGAAEVARSIGYDLFDAGVEEDPEIARAREAVEHPAHYTQGGIECIEAIEAAMPPEAYRGYLEGNVIKYLWRHRLKGGREDLRKAQWYLDRLVHAPEG